MMKLCIGLHVKYTLSLSDFSETLICRQIFEKTGISNFTKICSAGAELFHAEGRTDDKQRHRQTDRQKC